MGASSEVFSKQFGVVVLGLELLMIILYSQFTTYSDDTVSATTALTHGNIQSTETVIAHYPKFQDVHVMIFIGFGFLMTFLKKYGFSSVGFNFLISALVIQIAILNNNLWHQMFNGMHWHKIQISVTDLICGDFAAGAVMITFGAVLGKTSPLELVFVAIFEMLFYAINESIGVIELKVVDMGGSMFVHTFGAYFGLALSAVITPKEKFEEKDEGSVYHSDMFAMVGTIFLWMFWPSFNGALATGDQQHRVIINTVIALTASCVTTFVMSALMRHENKFDMVDIQNATLAGGVAVGSASDLVIEPWAAILIGCIAGFVSVIGYTKIQPMLQSNKILHDTCGVHNLHGMPGIIGGVTGAISAATAGNNAYGSAISDIWAARDANGDNRSAGEQAGYQAAALACTLAFAIVGGAFTGGVVLLGRKFFAEPKHYFNDAEYWEGVGELEGAPALGSLAINEDGDVEAPSGEAAMGTEVPMGAVGPDQKFAAMEEQLRKMQEQLNHMSGGGAAQQRSGCVGLTTDATPAAAQEP